MSALPLLRLEDLILPWLVVGGGVFVGLVIGMFLFRPTVLKWLLSVVVGLNLLLLGGLLIYMALSTASVCLSGQAITPEAMKILSNYQKTGWGYLLLMAFVGVLGLFFAWMGTLFFRPMQYENPYTD